MGIVLLQNQGEEPRFARKRPAQTGRYSGSEGSRTEVATQE